MTDPSSGDYALMVSGNGDFESGVKAGQRNWRFCDKCQELWFNGASSSGVCPAGGGHTAAGSGDYALISQVADFENSFVGQRDWRFCHDCLALWFNGGPGNGVCPAGGGHSHVGSGDYALVVDTDGVFN